MAWQVDFTTWEFILHNDYIHTRSVTSSNTATCANKWQLLLFPITFTTPFISVILAFQILLQEENSKDKLTTKKGKFLHVDHTRYLYSCFVLVESAFSGLPGNQNGVN